MSSKSDTTNRKDRNPEATQARPAKPFRRVPSLAHPGTHHFLFLKAFVCVLVSLHLREHEEARGQPWVVSLRVLKRGL